MSIVDQDDIYFTTAELAARWRISPETLANQRARGEGLPYHKPGGTVLYRVADVLEAERSRVFGLSFARIEHALRSLPSIDDKTRDKIMLHPTTETSRIGAKVDRVLRPMCDPAQNAAVSQNIIERKKALQIKRLVTMPQWRNR